ncbi:MAG: TRAP transporter large permease [Synergistaceae bacterium]|jgi:C4-dicarboxylate transporter DctM subunit|nr:TRAP transporter large permease [Synergistaceae bacterium]
MGAILGISFLLLAVIGAPIAMVLGVSSLAAIWLGSSLPLVVIPQRMFTAADSFPMLAIPLFMMAGSLMDSGGISRRLINLANKLVGNLTGGLALVSILTCMFFAAISGSGPATVAAIGGIMIPYMVKAGYDRGYASAVMSLAGAIGIIIPPSIPMVTYSVMSNVSVKALFTSGFGPGIVVGVSLMITAWWIAKRRGYGGEKQAFSWGEVLKAAKESFWALMMPVIILGGIYGSVFTPTEAAGVAVVYGLFIGLFVYRELNDIRVIYKILVDAAVTTAMIMLIVCTAQVFGWIMTSERIPDAMAKAVLEMTNSKFVVLMLINIILLFAGCIMETNASLIILAPILLPITTPLGVNPVHLGIIMVVNLAIGMSTPPLGVNLFVACGINQRMNKKLSLEEISWSALPFIAANVAALLFITYLEPISLFLPRLAGQIR